MGARRIVAIGDLNGAAGILYEILRGTRMVDARGRWTGGAAEVIQMGDLFNRGSGAREALELLLELDVQARRSGGRVTVLLGNHEVMTALRNEAYCTEREYLSFATARELREWPARVQRATRRLYRDHPPQGPVAPLHPRLDAWRTRNAPGQAALRRALSSRARLGRALRAMPVAHLAGRALFVHGGLEPAWAALGVAGLNAAARELWSMAPRFYGHLPQRSLFRSPEGPLWNRRFALDASLATRQALTAVLATLGVQRMIVGHTSTDHIRPGYRGHILTRFGGRLVCVDVGISDGEESPRTALVVEGRRGFEWTPTEVRLLWRDD